MSAVKFADLNELIANNISNQERINIFKNAIVTTKHINIFSCIAIKSKLIGYLLNLKCIKCLNMSNETFTETFNETFSKIIDNIIDDILSDKPDNFKDVIFPKYNRIIVDEWLLRNKRCSSAYNYVWFDNYQDRIDFMEYYLATYLLPTHIIEFL